MSKKYTILTFDGRRYICPVDLAKDVENSLEEVDKYWCRCDYSKDPPENLAELYGLTWIEGEEFTFENPKLDGEAIEVKDIDDPRQMELPIE